MIITGVVLAALLNTANAQFAIENNSKLGAKVENVSETTKRFLLDFGSDANADEIVCVFSILSVCRVSVDATDILPSIPAAVSTQTADKTTASILLFSFLILFLLILQ